MTRRALGVSILCLLFVFHADAQGQAGDKTGGSAPYAAGWGGGFQGRPWFDGGSGYPDGTDAKWFGYSGNPLWGYDAVKPKPKWQLAQMIIVLPAQASQPANESAAPARPEVHEYKWPDSGRPQKRRSQSR